MSLTVKELTEQFKAMIAVQQHHADLLRALRTAVKDLDQTTSELQKLVCANQECDYALVACSQCKRWYHRYCVPRRASGQRVCDRCEPLDAPPKGYSPSQ